MEATGKLESPPSIASSALNVAGEQGHSALNALNKPAPAVDRFTSSAHRTVDKLAQVASQAAQTLDEKNQKMRNTQARVMENCRHYVAVHPATSVGMALATGFLLRHMLRLR